MGALETMLLANAALLFGVVVLLWLVSLFRRDASIADPFWGSGFVLVAWLSLALAPQVGPRQLAVGVLVSLWGVRLSLHLLSRNLALGEDSRYQAMRQRHGARFPLVSFWTVFILQGVLLWVVSLPLQIVQVLPSRPLGPLDALGVTVWAVGFAFEAIGDRQLARFRSDPANRGQVMNRGLWRYTRHPNYFGDATQWWGLGCFAFAVGGYWTCRATRFPGHAIVEVLDVQGDEIEDRLERGRSRFKRSSAGCPKGKRRPGQCG